MGAMMMTRCALVLLLAVAMVHAATLTVEVQYKSDVLQPADISLRGDLLNLNWTKGAPMQSTSPTSWRVALDFTSADAGKVLEMKPLIADSSWSVGSNFRVQLPSSVVDSSITIFPWFRHTQGKYRVIGSLFSPQLNNTRDIIVYTPPS